MQELYRSNVEACGPKSIYSRGLLMSRTNRFWDTSTSLSLTRALLLLSMLWVLCSLTACVHTETTAATSINTPRTLTTFSDSGEGSLAYLSAIAYQPPRPHSQTVGEQDTVTVERCVRDSDLAPENADEITDLLVEQETIQRDLPETKLTQGMCQDIRDRAPGGSLVHKLVAAQNYVQEINFVEQAIRQVAGEASIETPPPQHSSAEVMAPIVGSASPSTILEEEKLYRDGGHRTSAFESSSTEPGTPREGSVGQLEIISKVAIESTTGALSSAQSDQSREDTDEEIESIQSDQYGPPPGPGGGRPSQDPPGSPASVRMSNAANQAVGQEASPEDVFNETKEAGERDGIPPEKADAAARCATTIAFVDNTLAELHRGAFEIIPEDIGKEMKVEDNRTVRLFLSLATRERFESLRRDLEKIDEVSETQRGCVGLSDRMKAALGGTKFEVEPQAEETQLIAAEQSTTWQWTVTATEKGRSPLYLNLHQEIMPAGGEPSYRPVTPPLYQAEVTIVATFSQRVSSFFSQNWQWLWAAILVPVAGWAWTRYRKRNAENHAEEQEE